MEIEFCTTWSPLFCPKGLAENASPSCVILTIEQHKHMQVWIDYLKVVTDSDSPYYKQLQYECKIEKYRTSPTFSSRPAVGREPETAACRRSCWAAAGDEATRPRRPLLSALPLLQVAMRPVRCLQLASPVLPISTIHYQSAWNKESRSKDRSWSCT
ncbi:uncharacterized protein [Lolium perenne]|uniref:uncharacterized protein n=1 Tax=Lolium perenne TaxID=4522 RepID=UPI003A9A4B67